MARGRRNDPGGFTAQFCCRIVIEDLTSTLKMTFGHTMAFRRRRDQNLDVLSRPYLWNQGRIEPTEFVVNSDASSRLLAAAPCSSCAWRVREPSSERPETSTTFA